ncbi:MAG: baseplate J/gp47 family protein [Aquamicrobium sp.]|uniref:baseplate assembly protein n=1 Tax=Aquamicrobium sp. TaxID=1872579 RepID=UPI00349EBEF0|nr:baseplate J/gp47 family protein [Aquamicrobium sp.]
MSQFSAITLDLSRFPTPLAIRGVDFETILDERKVRLVDLLHEAGVDYDVGNLEFDPAVILEETDAYRELLVYAAINDAYRAGLIAFAVGSDLDHLGLTAALGLPQPHRDLMLRRVIVPASGSTPAVMENDAEYRRRLLLAPEAYATAGTEGGFLFHALSADPGVINADVWSPSLGEVQIAIQARDGLAAASADLVEAVRRHMHRKDVKPLTDMVSVRSVTTHDYQIDVTVFIRPGPDPAAVRVAVEDGLAAMAASRRMPARDVPRSAIVAAASAGPVDRVSVAAPLADVVMGDGELAVCTGIAVNVETHDG